MSNNFTIPPITYFGRKHKVAKQIWELFGTDCKVYAEPFAGSLAVFLQRPEIYADIENRLNDLDGLVVNFWRSVEAEPQVIADFCTRPISEMDLHACHIECVNAKTNLVAKLCGDIHYYDVDLAKYWCYGINCWIGGNWCNSNGPWIQCPDTKMLINKKTVVNNDEGISCKKPIARFKAILSN